MAYGEESAFTTTPSWPRASASAVNASAAASWSGSAGSATSTRGTSRPASTAPASAARRTDPGSSSRSAPARWRASKTKSVNGVVAAPVVGSDAGRRARPGDLERLWASVGSQRDDLAVQDGLLGDAGEHGRDDLGHPVGDLVQGPGEDPDAVAVAVHLDPDPVELPLHAGRTGPLERCGQRRCGTGQHRRQRRPDAKAEAGQAVGAGGQGRHGDRPQVSGQCLGAADRHLGHSGRPRDGGEHHALLRALAQLAADQPGEQPLLRSRGPVQQRGEQVPALGLRAGPGQPGGRRERRVDLDDGQRRRGGGVGQDAQRRPADPRASLPQVPAQPGDHDRDELLSHRLGDAPPQEVGDQGHLGRARRRRRDRLR